MFCVDMRCQLSDMVLKWVHQRAVEECVLSCFLQATITPMTIEHVCQARLEIHVIAKQRILD